MRDQKKNPLLNGFQPVAGGARLKKGRWASGKWKRVQKLGKWGIGMRKGADSFVLHLKARIEVE